MKLSLVFPLNISVDKHCNESLLSESYFISDSPYFNKTLEEIEIMKMEEKQREDEKVLKSTVSDIEMFTNAGRTLNLN